VKDFQHYNVMYKMSLHLHPKDSVAWGGGDVLPSATRGEPLW
jgi:hypothetical protein